MTNVRFLRILLNAAAVYAIILTPSLWVHASAESASAFSDAYYSPNIDTLQAASPQGLRTYLSTNQSQYTEQSYVWGGQLIGVDGSSSYIAFEMQRNDQKSQFLKDVLVPNVTAAVLYNDGSGFQDGAVGGIAESQIPVAFNAYPWAATATQMVPLSQPEFVDLRAVEGLVGAKGTIYELTTRVISNRGQLLGAYVRVQDTTGIMQWGYGPSGFSPMWIFERQRKAITSNYGGSVNEFLQSTGDPMWSQGQYYFTMPMLKVKEFVITRDGAIVNRGQGGWLWFDNVARSYDSEAQRVVYGDGDVSKSIGWVEFSVAIPSTGEAFKIGRTQSGLIDVGDFPYATMVSRRSGKAPNGAFTGAMFWGIEAIHLKPKESSKWVSPITGNAYYLAWTVTLDKSSNSRAVNLEITQTIPNEEIVAGGRSVMEGFFSVSGTIGSRRVKGWSLVEVQNPGHMKP
jgi:hypothetical protein